MEKSSQASPEVGTVEAKPAGFVVQNVAPDKPAINPRRKLITIAGIVVGVIVLGLVGYFLWNHPDSKPAPAPKVTAASDVDYQLLTDAQLDQEFKIETGYDITKITEDDIDAKHFSTFYAAYGAAQIYAVKHDYKKSGEAYAVAADLADATTNYEFYQNYIAVADILGNKSLSKQLIEKEKAVIAADKSLSEASKQDLVNTINEKQKLKDL
jgi:hypothetical protein